MSIKISPKHLGPVYGPLDENSLPVLGMPVFSQFITGEWHIDHWPQFDDLMIMGPGFGNLLAINLIDGDFECKGQQFDPPRPAFWSLEDCKVVLRLLKEGRNFPNLRVYLDERDFTAFTYRSFEPSWIEKEIFGKTSFCVHYWLNTLVKNPEIFTITDDAGASADDIEKALIFRRNLTFLKDKMRITSDIFPVMLPGNMFMNFKDTGKDGNGNDTCTWNFEALEFKFTIMRNESNDATIDEEASAEYNILLNAFIYDLLPVFKRYNLISAIYFGTKYILDQGLRPAYMA